jgi:hypothetical protein
MDKEEVISFLLNNFMDGIEDAGIPSDPGIFYAIEACLRFACRAAININMPLEELEERLKEQWKWNEDDIKNEEIILN